MRASRRAPAPIGRGFLGVLLLLTLAGPVFGKHKDDVVVMKNGDRMTGEIRRMENGLLHFKSSYMNSSVLLDWNEVATLQSKDAFIVKLATGTRVTTPIERFTDKSSGEDKIALASLAKGTEVPATQVIAIQQMEESVWKQLKGNVDLGLSYTSGSSVTSFSVAAQATYQADKNVFNAATSSQFSSQKDAADTLRLTLNLQQQRFFANRWFGMAVFDYLRSDQQDLNSRTTYGLGIGKEVVSTLNSNWQVFAGFAYSRESYFASAGADSAKNSMEGLLGMKYTTFQFETLDVSWDATVYPSITDSPRVRFVTNGDLKIELIKDLYWSFRVYENYDTSPPADAAKSDFGVTSSLGYKF
jgi:hypothetical protein